jgi:hypothetical protein
MRAPVILRVVNGRVPEGQLPAVRASLQRDYVPAARGQAGLDRFLIAMRPADPGHEIALMTVWTDIESALAAYGGDLAAVRTLDGVDHGEVLESVDYYEVGPEEVRRGDGLPRHLRLTAGIVGHGLDADIQRDLRGRLVELEAEAVDAYVGRRVQGSSVEIAFVSTWSAAPAGRALDEPIWPDISTQYESFALRLFDVLIEGSPGD